MNDTDRIESLEHEHSMHHARLNEYDRWKASIPDAIKLRQMEHTHDELPSTDDLKRAVARNNGRADFLRKISTGIIVMVGAALLLGISTLMVDGIRMILSTSAGGG